MGVETCFRSGAHMLTSWLVAPNVDPTDAQPGRRSLLISGGSGHAKNSLEPRARASVGRACERAVAVADAK